ncbi:MAG: putative Ig domain-containing protein, partial [Planctomycetota bacterium]
MVFGNSKFAAAAVLVATFAMASTFGASFAPGALNQATAGTNTTQTITVTSSNLADLKVSAFIGGGTGLQATDLNVSLLNKTVKLSGTPSGAGTLTFSVDATEGAVTSSQPYTLIVNPALSVTPPFLNGAKIGVATNQTIQISGGTTPYASLTVSGFTDNGTGLTVGSLTPNAGAGQVTLSGTPSGAGSATFTVNATDAAGAVLVKNYTISVFQFSPTTFSSTQALSFTSQIQTITGGVKPYTSIVPNATAPGTTGLSDSNFAVDSNSGTVTFSGTPPTPGTFAFNIVVTDAVGNTFTTNNTIVITPAPISFTPGSLTAGTALTNYNQTITAIGGTGNKTLTYAVALPSGLSISPASGTVGGNSVTISGASPSAGTVTFNITATDSIGAFTTTSFTVTINLKYSPLTLVKATAGTATFQQVTVSGQTGALNFTGPTLSAGTTGLNPATDLTVNAGMGIITLSGTPTAAGTATFSLVVTDAGSGMSLNVPYSLTVNPALMIAPTNLASATVGTATNQVITVSNGTTPYTALTVTSFTPNATGLTQGSNITTNLGAGTVTLSGTPSGMGMATFNVNVTDTAGATTMKSYTLAVNPSLVINPSTLPGGDVGVAYDRTVTVTNGTTPYTALTVTGFNDSGTTGLLVGNITPTLATGAVRFMGTPTGTGTITFTVNATDTAGATLTNTYTVVINPALTIAIQPAAQAAPSMVSVALNPTTVGVMPVQTIKVSNG